MTGLVITVITTYALTALDTETSFAYVTGIYNTRMFGMAFFVTVMTTQTAAHMKEIAEDQHVASTNQLFIMKNQATADVRDFAVGPHIASSTDREMALVAQATVMGIDDAFMIATFLTVISLLLAFFIKNTIPEEEEPN